jgi:hypothetical protein
MQPGVSCRLQSAKTASTCRASGSPAGRAGLRLQGKGDARAEKDEPEEERE